MDSKEVIDHRDFVNGITSEPTVDSDAFIERLEESKSIPDKRIYFSHRVSYRIGSAEICRL